MAAVCLPALSIVAMADGVQIIAASPGSTISYTGTGSPNSDVTMEVSGGYSVGTSNGPDGKKTYKSQLNGIHIPGGQNYFRVDVEPVDTLSVTGSLFGIGHTMQGSVTNHHGSYSMSNVPSGTYNIVVSGIANGSAGSVGIGVKASQKVHCDSEGKFTASINSGGLPSGVYSVKQNGKEVAKVYLGVAAPATPTPTVTPTPLPNSTTNSTNPTNSTAGIVSVTPTASATASTTIAPSNDPSIKATLEPGTPANIVVTEPGEDKGVDWSWVNYVLIGVIIATIAIVAVDFFILKRK